MEHECNEDSNLPALMEGLAEQLVTLLKKQAESEGKKRRLEPRNTSDQARAICYRLLDAADVYDAGGCPLCQG